MDFIKLRLEGHLGKDPELRYTPQGRAVCTFSVAFNPGKKDDKKPPVWFICKAWNDLAIKISHFKKGEGIKIANAFLDVETWKDREGNDKSKQVWIVREVEDKIEQQTKIAEVNQAMNRSVDNNTIPPDIDESEIPF